MVNKKGPKLFKVLSMEQGVGKVHLNFVLVIISLLFLLSFINLTSALPTGVSISSNVTESKADLPAPSRTDGGGTITTMEMDVVQQNDRWKAYLGNLTGALSLSDSSGKSIFAWSMAIEDLTGEVYVSRNGSIDWEITVECANLTHIEDEDTYMGFNSSVIDSVNKTFNSTLHPLLVVGTTTILENTCNATSTYVNATAEDQASASYPVVLLVSSESTIYVTPINKGAQSYDNETTADFQIIVPDKVGETTEYYFYAEIGA
jgi:hypothetical protein